MCKVFNENDELVGVFVVSACNEVVNFTNIKTGEIQFKIYDKEALHGYVTCLSVSSDLIAIGYSSGTILVYSLKSDGEDLEMAHQFSFHRSPVTSVEFFNNNTQMASGSADTYIIIYDLVADTAQFKLLGHNEAITTLATFVYKHPIRGNDQTLLISGGKDGLIKFWDIEQQTCVLNTSDQYMSKIEAFVLIQDMNVLVAGSSDNSLKIFKLQVNKDTGAIECNFVSTIKKDSGARVLEMQYNPNLNQLMVLSSDGKFELIKVNLDNKDSILKKLMRSEKRKALKRKRDEVSDGEDEELIKTIKIDKDFLNEQVEKGEYDIGLHFSKKLSFELDQKTKCKSFFVVATKSKSQKQLLKIFISYHSN